MPRVSGKRATLESSDLKFENIGIPVDLRMPSFQKWLTELLGFLLPAISIVFVTNQNRSCNGTFESRSLRQACAVRNEDSRYENGIQVAVKHATSERVSMIDQHFHTNGGKFLTHNETELAEI